jgi:yecA family protein
VAFAKEQGALAWAQGLQLPDPKPAKASKPAPAKKAAKKTAAASMGMDDVPPAFGSKQEKHLRKICSNYPRLHGFLQALAWSPQVIMPNAWIGNVMGLHDRMPNSRTEATANKALQDALEATLILYNHLQEEVIDHLSQTTPGLDTVLAVVGEDEVAALYWAAGFVQGSETAAASWARHGHKVMGVTGSFGRLRGLAARGEMWAVRSLMREEDGKHHLQGLSDQPAAWSELQAVLQDLWPTVLRARQDGVQPG